MSHSRLPVDIVDDGVIVSEYLVTSELFPYVVPDFRISGFISNLCIAPHHLSPLT